jgi:hypothetical protein
MAAVKAGYAGVLVAVLGLLTGCNKGPNPYLSDNDPQGTPADRTGGARDIPWMRGGGPETDIPPPQGTNNKSPNKSPTPGGGNPRPRTASSPAQSN